MRNRIRALDDLGQMALNKKIQKKMIKKLLNIEYGLMWEWEVPCGMYSEEIHTLFQNYRERSLEWPNKWSDYRKAHAPDTSESSLKSLPSEGRDYRSCWHY